MSVSNVRLLMNDGQQEHGAVLRDLLARANQLDCIVAFANLAGFKVGFGALKDKLKQGLEARFSIGLDFYQTEPRLLTELHNLCKFGKLKLYVCNSRYTFHPKVYAFRHAKGCTMVTGSANMTTGGFHNNYEASVVVNDQNGVMQQQIKLYIDSLVNEGELVEATPKLIERYQKEYADYHLQQIIAKKRLKRLKSIAGLNEEGLKALLVEMRADKSDNGFDNQVRIRHSDRKRAKKLVLDLSKHRQITTNEFVMRYEELIAMFHSGGLHRGKNVIAQEANLFLVALADLFLSHPTTPADAYGLLHRHFLKISKAGVNVITEILHAIDSKSFAIMNQNAVYGMSLANVTGFPAHPNKLNVNSDRYEGFCQQADALRNKLGLSDFSELDVLFNYAYWRDSDEESSNNDHEENA